VLESLETTLSESEHERVCLKLLFDVESVLKEEETVCEFVSVCESVC
jgi:hypothetical protein